ncbi:MAG: flagellar assembly protein FliO [Rhodospirillaceae bacterium]|nr:MAG: flagellar assembly protein FliO [Rhodospirillaceae bacterium]
MDAVNYVKFILALVFVLGLIGLLTLVVRRFGLGVGQTPYKRAHEKRLKLVEVMPIDGKRRLLLFKRDNVEHLVILGATGETVIETNITISEVSAEKTKIPPSDFSRALQQASVLSQDDGSTNTKGPQT